MQLLIRSQGRKKTVTIVSTQPTPESAPTSASVPAALEVSQQEQPLPVAAMEAK